MMISSGTTALKAVIQKQQGTAVCRRTVVAAAVASNTTNVLQQQRSYFVCGGYTGLPAFTTNTTSIAIPQKLQFGTTYSFKNQRPLPLSFSYSPFVIISCSSTPPDVSTATVQFICTALYNFAVAAAAASTPKALQLTNFSSISSNRQVIPYCSGGSPSFLLGLLVQCIAKLLTRVKLLGEVRKHVQDKEILINSRKKIRSCSMKDFKKFYNKRQRFIKKTDGWAIEDYTGPGFAIMNAALRNGEACPELKGRIDAVLVALSKRGMKCYEGTVYRGVSSLPSTIVDDLIPGATFTDRAFLSTSSKKDTAFVSGNAGSVCFEIQSKTGINISNYSKHKNENEILFRPNTVFRILSVQDTLCGCRNVVMKEM